MTMQQQEKSTVQNVQRDRAVEVEYTNWKGEIAERNIIPKQMFWGKTEWHPQEQRMLKVWDLDRDAERDYAVKSIKRWW